MPVEEVITKDERAWLAANKLFSDQKGLRHTLRSRLDRIIDGQPQSLAISKERLVELEMVRRRNNEDLADIGQHEDRKGIINHGFVKDGQDLFGEGRGQRIQARAGSARQDDAF